MSDCCFSGGTVPKRYHCPVCAQENLEVAVSTILQHIKKPWQWFAKDQGYYFCQNPQCAVVYFAQDNTLIKTDALRTTVGIKAKTSDALICYCFGISLNEAAHNSVAKSFVIEQTGLHTCTCVTRNPSGRCCLKDFPKNKK